MRTPLPPTGPAALRLVGALGGAIFLAGCTLVGTAPPEPAPPAVIEGIAITDGPSTAADDAAVARLLTEGESLLATGETDEALARARRVEEEYGTASGSSRAIWLEARARFEREEWEEGRAAVDRFLERIPAEDDLVSAALLLRAEFLLDGDLGGGIEALFALPEGADGRVREQALARARGVARELDDPLLRSLVDEAPPHPWMLPVFQTEMAERRALVGDSGAALRFAEGARALAPAEEERERLARIEAGEVTPRGAVAGTLGALLSLDGSPTLQRLSEQIRDGIEVALLEEGIRGAIQLAQVEDEGVATASGRGLRTLEGRAPLGVVGPLTEAGLREAADARSGRVPIVSPIAPAPDPPREGIYSLTGVDPEAARALARLARAQGFAAVSILHSRSSAEEAEARWFREAFESEGGRVVQVLSYPAGATDFRSQLREVEARVPDALIVLAGPSELSILGAQLVFLGSEDRLEIPILGGSTWASDQTLASLPTSQTNGILSVAPHAGEGYGPRWSAFVEAYEGHFRRTLREPVPALGYDAVLLLVEAARRGGGTSPDEVLRGMGQIEAFAGATGTFSVREGRIVRQHLPVRLQNGARVPLGN